MCHRTRLAGAVLAALANAAVFVLVDRLFAVDLAAHGYAQRAVALATSNGGRTGPQYLALLHAA